MARKYRKCVIQWTDAASSTDVHISAIDTSTTNKFMVERATSGWLIKKDDHGVVVATDFQEDGSCEIFAIPTAFRPKIKYLTTHKGD